MYLVQRKWKSSTVLDWLLAMESIQRLSHRFFSVTCPKKPFNTISRTPVLTRPVYGHRPPVVSRPIIIAPRRNQSSSFAARAGWFLGKTEKKIALPDIVKAGDPVLHEPAQEVRPDEIGSERIQKIVDDMVKVMRKAPGVGLAAPQIGIPLRVSIVIPCTLWFGIWEMLQLNLGYSQGKWNQFHHIFLFGLITVYSNFAP